MGIDAGICGYGVYFPIYRIKVEEIAQAWGADGETIKNRLRVQEITVNSYDEDAFTIAVEAARNALKRAYEVDPSEIGAIYVGSESKPYAVMPTAVMVAEAIGASPSLRAADYEFACKAGTEAMITCIGLVSSGMIKYGLAIGADSSQALPGDVLEYTASAGGSAFIIGRKSNKTLAYFEYQYSYCTHTPDFWRRDGAPYPRHGGRFTGQPAYFKHLISAAKGLMDEMGLKPEDFDYFVPHQPNGTFPVRAARALGFDMKKLEPGLINPVVGNFYSGSSITGLCKVLDQAKPEERILLVSYGSGAGADAFSLVVQDAIEEKRNLAPTFEYYLNRKVYVDYATYVRFRHKIKFK